MPGCLVYSQPHAVLRSCAFGDRGRHAAAACNAVDCCLQQAATQRATCVHFETLGTKLQLHAASGNSASPTWADNFEDLLPMCGCHLCVRAMLIFSVSFQI